MRKAWVLTGVIVYALLTLICVPLVFGIPWGTFLISDDAGYSGAAVHLLREGFLSLDGVHPFTDREPGQSVLLALTYAFFGVENVVGIFIAHAAILLAAAWLFCHALAKEAGERAAGICFLLLLTSGSVLHGVFSAYRECLALTLMLLFAALWLHARGRNASLRTGAALGALLGAAILTYYSFFFFPPVAAALWVIERKSWRPAAALLCVAYLIVGVWGLRNHAADGQFRIVDARRADMMWYVRGEQALHVTGLEPLRCLWSEYVSRNWEGRSSACSFNAVKYARWGETEDTDEGYRAAGEQGKRLIAEHPVSYLWFSIVDVLELHAPYVGGGWGTAFNAYALATQAVMLAGALLGIGTLRYRRYWLFWLLIGYNTGVFALTDATPRYLVPVFFCYAAIAAIGYDRVLSRIRSWL